MTGTWFKRARMATLAGLASLGLSGCINDPEMWEGVAMGLNMASDQIAAENHYRAQCHPKSLSYMTIGNARYPDMLCPGDYGYNSGFVTPPVYGYGYNHRHHHHGHDGKHRDKRERKHRR